MSFRAIDIGGTGQVGAALIRALVAESTCTDVVMVNRKELKDALDPKVRQVVMEQSEATGVAVRSDAMKTASRPLA